MSSKVRGWLQKGLALFILIGVPLILAKELNRLNTTRKSLSFKEIAFIPQEVVDSEKEFVIIVVHTPKNEQYWERNLTSIFNQQYEYYRVVYLDGGSSDRLFERVQEFINEHDRKDCVTLLRSDGKRSLFERYSDVIAECKDEEVVIHFDGNDWFAHDKVLGKLNETYSSAEVWLAYGQYLEYPTYKRSSDTSLNRRLYTDRRFERMPWMTSPLKTYYAKLFKELNLDEIYQDDGAMISSDWNFMLPMVKMARCHIQYIPEVLYVHNIEDQ